MRDSLHYQSSNVLEGKEPSEAIKQKLIAQVLKRYPLTTAPLGFTPDGEINEVVMRGVIETLLVTRVKKTAQPGFPLELVAASNDEILMYHRQRVVNMTMERIKLLANMPPNLTARQMVEQGFCDPVKLFVKSEPHKKSKAEQKRWRLICSVSLVDQLVERVLCREQNDAEIIAWTHVPSAPGFGLAVDRDLKVFWDRIHRLAGNDLRNVAQNDMSGWDWSVKQWELNLDAECRLALMRAKEGSTLSKVMRNRVLCLGLSVFVTPDYEFLAQTVPGIQKSGSYNTSSTNSRVRVMVAWLCGAGWAIAMGDDCLEEYHEGTPERYQTLGHRCKMYERCDDTFEFCSSRFSKGVASPVDPSKIVFNFLGRNDQIAERLEGLRHELRHHPDADAICAAAHRMF